jgi:Ca2+-transporting ATPase
MQRPPRDPDRGIVDHDMLALIGGTGVISTTVMVSLLLVTLAGAPAVTPYAMTMVFTGFVFLEFEKLYVIRWLRETPTLSNRWLASAVGGSILLQLAVLYTPLNVYFGTVPLGLADWGLIGGILLLALPLYLAVASGVKRLWRSGLCHTGRSVPGPRRLSHGHSPRRAPSPPIDREARYLPVRRSPDTHP